MQFLCIFSWFFRSGIHPETLSLEIREETWVSLWLELGRCQGIEGQFLAFLNGQRGFQTSGFDLYVRVSV